MDETTMQVLKKAFTSVDKANSGFIPTEEMEAVLNSLGTTFDDDDLKEAIKKVDQSNVGKIDFEGFVTIVTSFIDEDDDDEEEEDDAVIMEELKEAFRLYDKEGNGYITTKVLKEILKELDSKLTDEDLNDIIEDIDEDNKGKIDFEHFKLLML